MAAYFDFNNVQYDNVNNRWVVQANAYVDSGGPIPTLLTDYQSSLVPVSAPTLDAIKSALSVWAANAEAASAAPVKSAFGTKFQLNGQPL